MTTARLAFTLPPALEARAPAEERGVPRDGVRMLVASRGRGDLVHARFSDLPRFLAAGDLVVVNTSATRPGALDALAPDGTPLVVHLSTALGGDRWVVEPRRPAGTATQRWTGGPPPRRVALGEGAALELLAPYRGSARLWVARLSLPQPVGPWLRANARPIRYGHVERPWPVSAYQNVYAVAGDEPVDGALPGGADGALRSGADGALRGGADGALPGSAEMPSAGRPFTPELVTRLVARGVGVTPVVLHTGVSSLEADELPYPERVVVPAPTASRVRQTRADGGRVIAVGTTVVRALEAAAAADGVVRPLDGWTDLVVTPERGVRAVDGLLTGWHEPEASHLLLLEAVAGRPLLERSYAASLEAGYLWHEFGDVHLVLP